MGTLTRTPRAYWRQFAWFACLLVSSSVFAASNDEVANPDQVKAAFIFQFTKYIHYPDSSGMNQENEFGVCASSDQVLSGALEEMENQLVNNLPVRFYTVSQNTDEILQRCQVLFVQADHLEAFGSVLEALKTASVLTITDADGRSLDTINIQLLIRDGKIRFRISTEALAQKNLTADAALLNLGLRN